MKKRKLLGLLTIFFSIPSLWLLLLSIEMEKYRFQIDTLGYFIGFTSGILGGVLLWRGLKIGYCLSLVAWLYDFINGLIDFWFIYTTDGGLPISSNDVFSGTLTYMLVMTSTLIVLNLSVVIILARDLFVSGTQLPIENHRRHHKVA